MEKLLKSMKHEFESYLNYEVRIECKKAEIETARGCDDFDTIEKQKKAIGILNEKQDTLIHCATESYGISIGLFIELLMEYEYRYK